MEFIDRIWMWANLPPRGSCSSLLPRSADYHPNLGNIFSQFVVIPLKISLLFLFLKKQWISFPKFHYDHKHDVQKAKPCRDKEIGRENNKISEARKQMDKSLLIQQTRRTWPLSFSRGLGRPRSKIISGVKLQNGSGFGGDPYLWKWGISGAGKQEVSLKVGVTIRIWSGDRKTPLIIWTDRI